MPEDQKSLQQPRDKIDAIDEQILDLLRQRTNVVKDVIQTKIKNKLPIYAAGREEEKVIRFRRSAEKHGIDPEWAEDFLRMIISASRASQSTGDFPRSTEDVKKVLIVGGSGGMGRLYHRFFASSGHEVRILEKSGWKNVASLVNDIDLVIISVPIPVTASVIKRIAPLLNDTAILADFTSNKNGLLPLMNKHHKGPVISLHPMHGPDVPNLSKQLMLFCPGNRVDDTDWLIRQFELWGMRIKEVEPEKHDHAMHLIQGLRHFVAMLHGSFMREYDLRPEDILDFSSPIYRAELMMTGRIFAQDAELYADIVLSNEERRKLLETFYLHQSKLIEIVINNDKQAFIREFEAISQFFGDFARQALRESSYLINRLSDRFA